jgi:hypothetical protein
MEGGKLGQRGRSAAEARNGWNARSIIRGEESRASGTSPGDEKLTGLGPRAGAMKSLLVAIQAA